MNILTLLTRWRTSWAALCMVFFAGGLASVAQAQAVEKPAAQASTHTRHARPQLATGAAIAPDGRLWVVGLNAQKQLFLQSTPLGGDLQWSPARILDTGKDPIAADGESRPKIVFGPNDWAVISYKLQAAESGAQRPQGAADSAL